MSVRAKARRAARQALPWASGIAVLGGLYATSLYSYLLFHSLAELFSIVVACSIFLILWNSRRMVSSGTLNFLGISFLFVGALDLLHLLAYDGMAVFQGYGTNLPTQLWIGARYLQAGAFLGALTIRGAGPQPRVLLAGFSLVTGLFLASLFVWDVFPDCHIPGEGLTGFKKGSEYAICAILAVSGVILVVRRHDFAHDVYVWLLAAIGVTILAELAFTTYVSVYGPANLIGHLLKIVAFYLLYKALIEAGLTKPYSVLFRNLKRSEERLRQSEERLRNLTLLLEERVETRTSELVESQAALLDSERRFRAIFEQSFQFVGLLSPSGILLEANRSALEFGGFPREEVVGRPFWEAGWWGLSTDTRTRLRQAVARAAAGEFVRYEAEVLGSGGRVITIDFSLKPVYDAQGRVGLLIPEGRDLSERLEMEAALRQSERLAAIGQMITGLSHESRNALQRAQACLEMLARRVAADSKALHLVVEAQRAQADLKRIHDEVREYAAPLTLDITREALPNAWREPWKDLGQLRDGRQATLVEIANGVADTRCEIDAFRMRQVFRNLLENSLAACADPVEVSIRCEPAELRGEPALRVALRDNGPGLDDEQAQRIFEPFYTTKTKGTGLGMSIVKRIVEAHGGVIELDPGRGRGLEVSLIIPRRYAAPASARH